MSALGTNPRVVVFGAGAVGGTIGGWITPHHGDLLLLDQGRLADAMEARGITLYQQDQKDERETVRVNVIRDLAQAAEAEVVLICVKNYSLDAVARAIKEKVGDRPIVVGFQNGLDNQAILPKYFSKCAYGIVGYNAWIDEPGVIGFQKRGPLILGTPGNTLGAELRALAEILGRGVETQVTDRLQDAVHTKMIVNLTNSLTTLLGVGFREISDRVLFQKLLTGLTYEGVQITRAAGFREVKMSGMPPWALMAAAARLPAFLTRRTFEKNAKKMVLSSMAQDILQRGGTDSELESLNGYFVKLADKHGLAVPYNRTVYRLCVERFGRPGFQPMDVRDVWGAVRSR